jgi:Domain of unknown function (DUF4258)
VPDDKESIDKRAEQAGSDFGKQPIDILKQVREAAAKRILFLPHAVNQMNSPDRLITTQELRAAVFGGLVIEEYPEDVRGHSCLILGWGEESRPLHVVCAPKSEYLAIITAYLPSPHQWEPDWRTRKKR